MLSSSMLGINLASQNLLEASPTENQNVWAFQKCVLLLSRNRVEDVGQAHQQEDINGDTLAPKSE